MTKAFKASAYENPVFHGGPRSCVGQPLARLEILFALAECLGRYEFESGWSGVREVGEGLTAPMVGGLKVKVRRRTGSVV